jgi:hypothetical protein
MNRMHNPPHACIESLKERLVSFQTVAAELRAA